MWGGGRRGRRATGAVNWVCQITPVDGSLIDHPGLVSCVARAGRPVELAPMRARAIFARLPPLRSILRLGRKMDLTIPQ